MTHALKTRADDFADPGYQPDKKPRYQIDTPDHVRAGWAYINQADNAKMYTAAQLEKVKARIKTAADKFGIQIGDETGRAAFLDVFGADIFSRWTDSLHPHAPAGSPQGGEFAPSGGSGASASKPQAKKGHPAPAAHHQAKKAATPSGNLCTRDFGFEFEARAGDGRTLEGYAAVFDSPTRIRDLNGDFEETIRPGAFKRSLATRMPILQWDHGKDPRVGTVPIGAIDQLSEDSRGLHVRARLFDNQVVEPVRQAIAAKAVKGMSFRFGVPEGGDTWTRRSGAVDLREIGDADVHELGPVAFPAYDNTSVSVRSLLDRFDLEERRALLRELAADERLAVDLSDLTGRSVERIDDGGDPGAEPEPSTTRTPHLRQRLDEGALRARGILK